MRRQFFFLFLYFFLSFLLIGFLLWRAYPRNQECGQVFALAVLQLLILMNFQCKFKALVYASDAEMQPVYYSGLLLLYAAFFLLISFVLSLTLYFLPAAEFATSLITFNYQRMRIGLYLFGLLLFLSSRRITRLGDTIFTKKIVSRYYSKSIVRMLNRSPYGQHSLLFQSVGVSLMLTQIF
jgi:hypothetical protein